MPEYEATVTFRVKVTAKNSRAAAKEAGHLVDSSIERVSVTTVEVPK